MTNSRSMNHTKPLAFTNRKWPHRLTIIYMSTHCTYAIQASLNPRSMDTSPPKTYLDLHINPLSVSLFHLRNFCKQVFVIFSILKDEINLDLGPLRKYF